MDYIEFKIIDDSIVCRYVYNKKETMLSNSDTVKLFRFLNNSNYSYKEGIINGDRALRYYGVRIDVINKLLDNRNKTKKKVSRVNKYATAAGVTATMGGILSIALILNSMGILDNLAPKKESVPEVSISIGESIDHDIVPEEPAIIEDDNSVIDNSINQDEEIVITDYTFNVNYEDRSDIDKANITRELYTNIIDKYSKMYGLPTNLMVAVATQESGIHHKEVSKGGGLGLFQIQIEGGWNWLGRELTAYNFELGKYETIDVCKKDKGSIDKYMLSDLEYNVKIACMIMAHDLKICKNDLVGAIQFYNSGSDVLDLKREYGDNWIEFRDNLPGDPMYLEHVLSYISEEDSLLQYKTSNNETYVLGINNVYNNSVHKTM